MSSVIPNPELTSQDENESSFTDIQQRFIKEIVKQTNESRGKFAEELGRLIAKGIGLHLTEMMKEMRGANVLTTGDNHTPSQLQLGSVGDLTCDRYLSSSAGDLTFSSVVSEEPDTWEEILSYFQKYHLVDQDKTDSYDFVMDYRPKIERLIIKAHQLVGDKLEKNLYEKDIVNNANVDRLPKTHGIDGVTELLNWLRRFLYFKVKYFVPDHLLRSRLVEAVGKAQNEPLKELVAALVAKNRRDDHIGIDYLLLLKLVKQCVPEIVRDPLEGIKQRFKDVQSVNVTMATIVADVANLMVDDELTTNTGALWVGIWRVLYQNVPETMAQAVELLPQETKGLLEEVKYADASSTDVQVLRSFKARLDEFETKTNYIQVWNEFRKVIIRIASSRNLPDQKLVKKKTHQGKASGEDVKAKQICNVCGEEHHFKDCEKLKELNASKQLVFHHGQYHSADSTPLPLQRGEAVLIRYADKFPNARPSQNQS